jgi:hypothetical protein
MVRYIGLRPGCNFAGAAESNALKRIFEKTIVDSALSEIDSFAHMNHRIAHGLSRFAARAARPAKRGVIRALRHHSARTHALAEQIKHVHPVDGIRSWFRGFFGNLRVQAVSRKVSLRALLRPAPLRAPSSRPAKPKAAAQTSRRPRRVSASSEGWYAFAAR